MVGKAAELIAHYYSGDEMTSSARLLDDAIRDDGSLFTRDDCVEAARRVVEAVRENVTPVFKYEPGTWGPPEAHRHKAGTAGTIPIA
jgi:glucose-6-phosphate 1-dehydrogenase